MVFPIISLQNCHTCPYLHIILTLPKLQILRLDFISVVWNELNCAKFIKCDIKFLKCFRCPERTFSTTNPSQYFTCDKAPRNQNCSQHSNNLLLCVQFFTRPQKKNRKKAHEKKLRGESSSQPAKNWSKFSLREHILPLGLQYSLPLVPLLCDSVFNSFFWSSKVAKARKKKSIYQIW